MTTPTALIEKQISDLYLHCCMPRLELNTETGRVTISYKWTSTEAEALYNQLCEILHDYYQKDIQAQAEKQRLFYRDYKP